MKVRRTKHPRPPAAQPHAVAADPADEPDRPAQTLAAAWLARMLRDGERPAANVRHLETATSDAARRPFLGRGNPVSRAPASCHPIVFCADRNGAGGRLLGRIMHAGSYPHAVVAEMGEIRRATN